MAHKLFYLSKKMKQIYWELHALFSPAGEVKPLKLEKMRGETGLLRESKHSKVSTPLIISILTYC